MAMIVSAPFIDGKLVRRHTNHWTNQPHFQVLSLQNGEAVALRKGSISARYRREMAFLEPRNDPESVRNPEFLDRAENFADHSL